MEIGDEQHQRRGRDQAAGDDRHDRPARAVHEIAAGRNGENREPDREAGQRGRHRRRRSLRHHQQRRVAEEQHAGEIHHAPDGAGDHHRDQRRTGQLAAAGGGAACGLREVCGMNANAQSTATAQTAPDAITADQPERLARSRPGSAARPWRRTASSSATATSPARSRGSSNQSATILVATRMTIVAPTPPIDARHQRDSEIAGIAQRQAGNRHQQRGPPVQASFRRTRWPSKPAGNATMTPGNR